MQDVFVVVDFWFVVIAVYILGWDLLTKVDDINLGYGWLFVVLCQGLGDGFGWSLASKMKKGHPNNQIATQCGLQ